MSTSTDSAKATDSPIKSYFSNLLSALLNDAERIRREYVISYDSLFHKYKDTTERLTKYKKYGEKLQERLKELETQTHYTSNQSNQTKDISMPANVSLNNMNVLPDLPINIRHDVLITISGLPKDFSMAEAEYIAGILRAYAQPINQPTFESFFGFGDAQTLTEAETTQPSIPENSFPIFSDKDEPIESIVPIINTTQSMTENAVSATIQKEVTIKT